MRARWRVVVGTAILLVTLTGCQPQHTGAHAPKTPVTPEGNAAFAQIEGLERNYPTQVTESPDYEPLFKKTAEKEHWAQAFDRARQAVLDLEAAHTNGTRIDQNDFDKILEAACEPYRQMDMIRKIKQDPTGYRNKLRNTVQATLPIHQQLDDMLRRNDSRIRKVERAKLRDTLKKTKESITAVRNYEKEVARTNPDFTKVGEYRRTIIIQYESLHEIHARLLRRQVTSATH